MQYAIQERSEGIAKPNNPFLRLTLTNKEGDLKAVWWECPEHVAIQCQVGTVIEPVGQLGEYRGEKQMKITNLAIVPAEEIRYADLLPTSPKDSGAQIDHLVQFIGSVNTPELKAFLTSVFDGNTDFMRRYVQWPAAVSYHHAWVGGLLDHSLEVAMIATSLSGLWPDVLDRDLLIAGALLHDVGKLEEIQMGTTFSFSTQGRLLGHTALGVQRLKTVGTHLTKATYTELEHMIASHQGELEHGALAIPRTANAVALHLADAASAKMTPVWQTLTACKQDWSEPDKVNRRSYYAANLPVPNEPAEDTEVPF